MLNFIKKPKTFITIFLILFGILAFFWIPISVKEFRDATSRCGRVGLQDCDMPTPPFDLETETLGNVKISNLDRNQVKSKCFIRKEKNGVLWDDNEKCETVRIENSSVDFDYEWSKEFENENKYLAQEWQPINTNRIQSLTPKVNNLVEKEGECQNSNWLISGDFLRREGGMLCQGFWLEYTNLGILPFKISNSQEFKKQFLLIENEQEAVGFVANFVGDLEIEILNKEECQRDYKNCSYKNLSGNVTKIENEAYLVQLVQNNTFGCRNHETTKVIYKVEKTGDFQIIAQGFIPNAKVDLCRD